MTNKELKQWENFRNNLIKETIVEVEDYASQNERIKKLEAKPEEWFKYYFPNYYTAEPAPFHKAATKRILENEDWYEVRAWARELAKSARAMMEDLYLTITGKSRFLLEISHTKDSAVNLLQPYKINLESNKRIINDYGEQIGYEWSDDLFITKNGVMFLALGSGQSPRGRRNEEIRPDIINFDDIDTDEEVRNKERIKTKWNWIEQAVIPTTSVSKGCRIRFNGNIIGKDTCITRAMKYADHSEIVNIRNKNGKSTWPQKNTEEHINRRLKKLSAISAQKEYFNNPVSEGNIFKSTTDGDIPSLNSFKYLVCYGDPSPSNKENKKNSNKALWLIGKKDGVLYIIFGFNEQTKNENFVKWYYEVEKYVAGKTSVYYYIENNNLQDPFYEQVIIPLFDKEEEISHKIAVKPDRRKKPEKFTRIESNLEPLNSQGRIVFNVKEKNNPHMIRLKEQFLALDTNLSFTSDGPDCIEGANWVYDKKAKTEKSKFIGKKSNKNSHNRI